MAGEERDWKKRNERGRKKDEEQERILTSERGS